jgi:hypothetical protein
MLVIIHAYECHKGYVLGAYEATDDFNPSAQLEEYQSTLTVRKRRHRRLIAPDYGFIDWLVQKGVLNPREHKVMTLSADHINNRKTTVTIEEWARRTPHDRMFTHP